MPAPISRPTANSQPGGTLMLLRGIGRRPVARDEGDDGAPGTGQA